MFKKKIHYLILLFTLNGCVEHVFFINIKPTGNYNINYQCNGNLDDINNFDFPIPNTPDWEITNNIKKKNDSYFFSANRNFKNNERILTNFSNNDSIPYESKLKHPLTVKKTNYIFLKLISFECTFKSRETKYKYPSLSKWLDDPNNDTDNIIKEILKYIINQSIENANLGFNIYPIIKNDINKWFNNQINHLPDSIIFNNFENYLNKGSSIIKSNLINDAINIDSLINIYKLEADITMNLIDDDFNFKIKMPNYIFSHNSDTIINDTLIWQFSIKKFSNNNNNIYAHSYKILYFNIIIFFIIIFFVFIFKKNIFFRTIY